jgi:hypothetical protein
VGLRIGLRRLVILVFFVALSRSCEDRCDKLQSQMGDDAIFARDLQRLCSPRDLVQASQERVFEVADCTSGGVDGMGNSAAESV